MYGKACKRIKHGIEKKFSRASWGNVSFNIFVLRGLLKSMIPRTKNCKAAQGRGFCYGVNRRF